MMQLTTESRRAQWIGLLGAWAIAALLLWLHLAAYRDYVQILDRTGLRGTPAAGTPLRQICPDADTQMWVRHAIALTEGAGPQMRFTHADNAPYGREVHWDSGLPWLIVLAGSFRHELDGTPWPQAIEQAIAWFNLPLLMAFVIALSTWVSRRAGLGAGVFLTFAMMGNDDFYNGFSPFFVGHHGVFAAAVLGLVLGVAFMGAGFWRVSDGGNSLLPRSVEEARRAAVFSAVCGGIGMWVSAPTLVPAIAICGIAGAGLIAAFGRRAVEEGASLEPAIWRLWGAVGGTISLIFYLLEYAPHHLGLRLEVNHPFYAAAWWGGGEVIAQIAEWRLAGKNFRPRTVRLTLAAAAILLAPATIALGGSSVFVVFDPFVAQLAQYVSEGYSLAKAVRVFGPAQLWNELPWTGAALGLGAAGWWRCRFPDRVVVAFAGLAAVAATAMAAAQLRWWTSAAAMQIVMILVAVVALAGRRANWLKWSVLAVVIGALCLPPAISRIATQRRDNRRHLVDRMDALQPLYRDIARALRASQPGGNIILLASPNASDSIGYYGRLQTIGTLYWENVAGLRAAAGIFSAQSPDEARRLVRKRGITHMVMISEENFLAQYFSLLHSNPNGESLESSFGYQLLVGSDVPLWLEPIPYDAPRDVRVHPERIALFKTRFSSPPAEADYEAALKDLAFGDTAAAEDKLDAALALAPDSAEFWLAKARLLLGRGDAAGALAAVNESAAHAAPAQRFGIFAEAAYGFHANGAFPETAQLCRQALALHFDATIANNLVWLLATCADDRVRNGAEALKLAERLAPDHPEYRFRSAQAAALAECGRFREAVELSERAMAGAKKTGDEKGAADEQQHLAAYRASRPWRE
ncbi:MAG TPA: hypothetical protein VMI53_06645 [Opitutaceae bacterium]|nr:hypothetical protein [Opitutaceae bacterium]